MVVLPLPAVPKTTVCPFAGRAITSSCFPFGAIERVDRKIKRKWEIRARICYGRAHTGLYVGYGDGGSGATEEMIELMHRFDKLSGFPNPQGTVHSLFDPTAIPPFADGSAEMCIRDRGRSNDCGVVFQK